ncbi:O-methyltransferase [Salinisphaera orenii]|uniref:O-methyltransferase n=1 Tax=Salinisphaera orenii TaxID=856731 RepID=UPI00296F65B5
MRESAAAAANRQTTEAAGRANLQIDPEQGQQIYFLARLIGARQALELGVFAGYSALWLADALGSDGRLLACDSDPAITERARSSWAEAGLSDRIELVIDKALAMLDRELNAGHEKTYDMALIDADKVGYIDYYERCLRLVRPGGLILADNTLWHGQAEDPRYDDANTEAIRAFNRHLHADARIDLSVLPVGDGLTLARVL